MKSRFKHLLIITTFTTCMASGKPGCAQSSDMQQLILDIEKLTQLKGILSDMKTGYRIYKEGYDGISRLSKGNFDLHSLYLNGLLQISPAVKGYSRIAEILAQQSALLTEYRSSYKWFSSSGIFSAGELDYIGNVYAQLVNRSLSNLDDL